MSTFNFVCFSNFSFSIHFSQCLLYEPIRGLFLTCAFAIKHAINRDLMATDGSIFPTIWLGALPTTLSFPLPLISQNFPRERYHHFWCMESNESQFFILYAAFDEKLSSQWNDDNVGSNNFISPPFFLFFINPPFSPF